MVLPEGERQGMDRHELGTDACAEFVIHADEFIQRVTSFERVDLPKNAPAAWPGSKAGAR